MIRGQAGEDHLDFHRSPPSAIIPALVLALLSIAAPRRVDPLSGGVGALECLTLRSHLWYNKGKMGDSDLVKDNEKLRKALTAGLEATGDVIDFRAYPRKTK